MHEFNEIISQKYNDVALALLKLDNYTFNHSYRVHKLALLIGKELRLSSGQLRQLEMGALFHDLGKVKIKRSILNKTTSLADQEWELIKTHPQEGFNLVKNARLPEAVQHIVLFHHRWVNGKGGYPLNPLEYSPCLLTQIVTVSDVVDAMTSKRPYRDAIKLDNCIQYLIDNCNQMFSRQVVAIIIKLRKNGVLTTVMNIN